MPEYEVEFHLVKRVRFAADDALATRNAVAAIHPGARIVYACRVDLLGDIKPDPDAPAPPLRPRGKPTPGGGSPAGGVARRPVMTEAVAAAA